MAALAARVASPEASVCPGSLVLVARRPAALRARGGACARTAVRCSVAAHTDDEGRTWSAPAAVDTTDQAVSGCRRAPPAIAADSASGYVHVVFALLGREGPGLFFAHSMDGGATFHSAVPIFYGDRLGRIERRRRRRPSSAVAFEDPNSRAPRIGLALSRTMGHIFEERLLPISDDNEIASRPARRGAGPPPRRGMAARRPFRRRRRDVPAVRTGTLR